MINTLPDKWIRRYIFNNINNMIVDGKTIPCFDYSITGNEIPTHYVLISTQTNTELQPNKCNSRIESSVLIDVFTRFLSTGNTGSRLLADNIAQEIITRLSTFELDAQSGLKTINFSLNMPNDLESTTQNEKVYRKLLRYELILE